MLDIQTMCSYIQKAAEAEEIDLDSEMIADFCLASDTYDSLTEDEQAAVNSGIREALETVRNRIAAQISSVNGVTVTGNPWYVQLHVQESSDGQQTMQQLSETYPGTLPQLLYDIEISYTDIRTGEAYQPMTMISLAFPVPEGYESLTKPRILRSAEDSFMELTPQMQEDGTSIWTVPELNASDRGRFSGNGDRQGSFDKPKFGDRRITETTGSTITETILRWDLARMTRMIIITIREEVQKQIPVRILKQKRCRAKI